MTAGVALSAGATVGWSEMAPSAAGTSSASLANLSVASGKIASIDKAQKMISVQTSPFTKKDFKLDASAKITDGSKSLQLDQLQQGAEVTVQYAEGADGKDVARQITVNGANAAAQPANASKPAGAASSPSGASSAPSSTEESATPSSDQP